MITILACIHMFDYACVCGLRTILLRFVPEDVTYVYVCTYVE